MAMISMETVDYIARVLEIRGTFFRMVARASREHPHRVIRQTVLAIYVHVLPVALAIARPSYDHFQPHSLGESPITAVLLRRLTIVRQNIRASILRTSCGFGRLATFINRMYVLTLSFCWRFQCWTGVGVLRENEAPIFNGLMLGSTNIRL